MRLGDVGILEDRIFRRTDTLASLGINDLAIRRGQGTQVLEFTSREGVEINSTLGAESTFEGLGGELEINFSRDGAVFLRIGEHVLEEFESTDTLGREIMQRYENNDWRPDRVVVTEVVKAAAAIVLVSGSGSAAAKFKLDAAIPAAEAAARGNLKQVLSFTGSFSTKIVGEKVSPLLRTCGVRGVFRKSFRSGAPALISNDGKVAGTLSPRWSRSSGATF